MEHTEPKEGFLARLPAPLKRWLEQSARLNRRSMNAELTILLEQRAAEPPAREQEQ
jgi:hypothetical protein